MRASTRARVRRIHRRCWSIKARQLRAGPNRCLARPLESNASCAELASLLTSIDQDDVVGIAAHEVAPVQDAVRRWPAMGVHWRALARFDACVEHSHLRVFEAAVSVE